MPGCFEFYKIKSSRRNPGQCVGLSQKFSFQLTESGPFCYHSDIYEDDQLRKQFPLKLNLQPKCAGTQTTLPLLASIMGLKPEYLRPSRGKYVNIDEDNVDAELRN